jgi:putative peptidoglycan lipid II flippase
MIGIAMGVAVFPGLSRLATLGRTAEMRDELGRAMRMTLFLALPATTGLAVLAAPLIRLIYEHGRFDAASSAETARVLVFYAIGVFATCGLQVVTRAFYAMQDMKTPVRVTAATIVLNLALNLALVGPLGAGGLALATSITAIVNLGACARWRGDGIACSPFGLWPGRRSAPRSPRSSAAPRRGPRTRRSLPPCPGTAPSSG